MPYKDIEKRRGAVRKYYTKLKECGIKPKPATSFPGYYKKYGLTLENYNILFNSHHVILI